MRSLPGPDNVTRVVFANGLTVLVRENHAAPVAVLEGSLPAGSLHEPADKAGLAAFTAQMLTRGSAGYDFDAFNDTIEAVGGNLTVAADTHSTDFSITCLSEDFPTLVSVLADVLQRPTLPDDHVAKVRQKRLVQLQERDQDTASVANLRFHEAIFGRSHPYGRAGSGYLETIGAITRDDLVAFHAQHYTPHGAIVVVAGDVQTGAVLDLLQSAFGNWSGPAADQTTPPFPASGSAAPIRATIPGKVQSDLVIGARAVARHDADFYAVRVANCILGQFGLMGRLGESVREELGLAYYCYSSLLAESAGGAWLASAGVDPANTEQAIDRILHEFAILGDAGVDAEELADSQAYLTGVVPLTLETNEGVASMLLNMEWHDLGLDFLYRYDEIIYGVTTEDVRRVTSKYLRPQQCTVVVAGP